MTHFGMSGIIRALSLELLAPFEWHQQLLRKSCWDLYVLFLFPKFYCQTKQSLLANTVTAKRSRAFGISFLSHISVCFPTKKLTHMTLPILGWNFSIWYTIPSTQVLRIEWLRNWSSYVVTCHLYNMRDYVFTCHLDNMRD